MKVLLIQEGSSVVVRVPTPGANIEQLAKAIPNSRVVDQALLPTDREFRKAWTIFGTIDLEKAKDVWRDKIRVARDKKIKELDIKWMKAMEKGELTIAASIAADKQILRDLPAREEISRATTLEELKSFWPSILEG
jgi:hypothetical protein